MVRDTELPPANVRRWTVYRKAEVVRAVRDGLLTIEEASKRYKLSKEELRAWERDFDEHGLYGLRATQLYRHSKPPRRT